MERGRNEFVNLNMIITMDYCVDNWPKLSDAYYDEYDAILW
jgi:hypothetical protein